VFLKEKPTATQTVFTVISFLCVGCISIISESGNNFSLLGLLLLILAVVCAASFNILSRSTAGVFSAAERTYIMFAASFLVFAVLPFFTMGNGYFGEILLAVTNINIIISIIYLSVLSSVCAFLMYNYCTGKIGVVKASSYSNIITVISVPAGIIFLKEEVSLAVLILCVIIMFCVYMVNKISNKG
jgi:drug/metabolite transporter (DMT)-like permease